MKEPMITLPYSEFTQLKKLEQNLMNEPFITYHFHGGYYGSQGTLMFIVNADDNVKKMSIEISSLKKKADEVIAENKQLKSQLFDLQMKKKWYEFWK